MKVRRGYHLLFVYVIDSFAGVWCLKFALLCVALFGFVLASLLRVSSGGVLVPVSLVPS